MFAGLPAILYCATWRLGLKPNARHLQLLYTAFCLIACTTGYLFENPNRHIQLLGYMLPKAMETYSEVLKRKGIYKARNWHAAAVWMLTWALIAAYTLQSFYKKRNNKRKE